jgi:hypothetical protein
MDLFAPVLPMESLHPNFQQTLRPDSASVRAVLNDWADGFVDRDGKFVREFQTTYNSCFWELYLFAVTKKLGIVTNFSYSAPDFVSTNHAIAIEATIASNAKDDTPEWEKTPAGIAHDDLNATYIRSIIRLSNAFLEKSKAYKEKYAALPHMKSRSYIIAISNYGTQDFHMLGDVAMQRLLYDVWQEHEVLKENGSPISVGLFKSKDFSHVSAVIYSSLATFGKARALSNDNGNYIFNAIRIRNNSDPIQIVTEKKEYQESLTDGLRLFVNPHASAPIDPELFSDPGIRRFISEPGGDIITSCHPDGDLCLRMVYHLLPDANIKD